MKKYLLAGGVALALSVGAGVAHAETTGSGTMQTAQADGSHPHSFTTDYTCQDDGTITFTFTSANSGSGDGTLTPGDEGGDFEFDGANGAYEYYYEGSYDADGVWYDASATDNNNGSYPGVTGNFTGIPDCGKDNHGQYVSGAAKAGVTGKDLAAIAKDKSKVGPYPG